MALKLIFGSDEYLVGLHARKAVNAYCPEEEQALGLEIISGDVKVIDEAIVALKSCIGAVRTVGLFGGQKTVWLRDATLFKDKVISKNETVKGLLNTLAEEIRKGLDSSQNLVISAPGVDKRSVFFKACQSAGEVQEFELPEQEYKKKPLIRERARALFTKAERKIDPDAFELFLEKVGTDTRQLVMEAEKLILYAGEARQIHSDDVQAITSSVSESITWDFTDALGERRLEDALSMLRRLLYQGMAPIAILYAVQRLYQTLTQYRAFLDKGWVELRGANAQWCGGEEMERTLGQLAEDPRSTHPFRAGKLIQQARNYSGRELKGHCDRIIDVHEQMVSSGVSQALLLEILVIRLVTRTRSHGGGAAR